MNRSEILLDAHHARKDFLSQNQGVGNFREVAPADITSIAALATPVLSKVLHELAVSTASRDTIPVDRLQQRFTRRAGICRTVRQNPSPQQHVVTGVQQPAFGVHPVASGAARFLLVVSQRFGHPGVNHEPHIGLVDTHSKGDRRHDDLRFVVDEGFLPPGAFVVAQSGVVRRAAVAELLQRACQRFGLGSTDAINQSGLITMPIDHRNDLIDRLAAFGDVIDKVGTKKISHQDLGIAKPQRGGDFFLDGGCRGCGVSVHRDVAESIPQHSQFPILRAKIVSPDADAVSFVDGKITDTLAGQKLQHLRPDQCLWGQIQQSATTAANLIGDLSSTVGRLSAVKRRGRDSDFAQGVDLVLHQRNQRRNDDSKPFTTNHGH